MERGPGGDVNNTGFPRLYRITETREFFDGREKGTLMKTHWRRWEARQRQPRPAEPLSADKIDMGYRLYWTKTALTWDAARRTEVAARVAAVIAAPGFENNALERRYAVESLETHSGASLLALAAVLQALDEADA
jgi:hypothetical protein